MSLRERAELEKKEILRKTSLKIIFFKKTENQYRQGSWQTEKVALGKWREPGKVLSWKPEGK